MNESQAGRPYLPGSNNFVQILELALDMDLIQADRRTMQRMEINHDEWCPFVTESEGLCTCQPDIRVGERVIDWQNNVELMARLEALAVKHSQNFVERSP
jgi:hypothetical protein